MTEEIWIWGKTTINSYGWNHNFFIEIILRFLNCLEILIGQFLLSNITAIYIKMTVICAPIFILMISNFFFLLIYIYILINEKS